MKRLDRIMTMSLAVVVFAVLVTAAPRCAAQTVIGNWESSMSEGWFDWNCCTGTEFQPLQLPRFALTPQAPPSGRPPCSSISVLLDLHAIASHQAAERTLRPA